MLWMILKTTNLSSRRSAQTCCGVGKMALGAIGGAAIIGPAVFVAAPSLAAALGATGALGAAGTGTAISTLSGAALTNASLAAIGGGTMAGGVAVVSAAGASLGAAVGGVVSHSYFSQVRDFSVRKHNEGRGPAIIFVNGFLTQDIDDPKDWKQGLRNRFSEVPWYHVIWESKTLAAIGSMILRASNGAAAYRFAVGLAEKAAKRAGGRLSPAAWATLAADLIGNPWHLAMVRASMTGILTWLTSSHAAREQEFVLMGHSLGARVIYYALSATATKATPVSSVMYLISSVERSALQMRTIGTMLQMPCRERSITAIALTIKFSSSFTVGLPPCSVSRSESGKSFQRPRKSGITIFRIL